MVGGSKPELTSAMLSATKEGSGLGSFRTVKDKDGKMVHYYVGNGANTNELGIDRILERAWGIYGSRNSTS